MPPNKYLSSALASIIILGLVFLLNAVSIFPAIYAAIFSVIIIVYTIFFYRYAKKVPFSDTTLSYATFIHLTVMSIAIAFAFFNFLFLFLIVLGMSIAFFVLKVFYIRDLAKILFMFLILFIATATLLQPAIAISSGQGTVLTDNWWNALNWMRNNTADCAVVATYWDPGHFIRGIANRPVVFDGASQNALWNITVPSNISSEQIKDIAVTDKFRASNITVNGEQKTLIETARIQDISTTLMTDNETLALKILEKYRIPGCTEMYYLATSDLIGKSYWWTYFSTWNPIDKGCATPMSQLGLKQSKPSANGGITYVYYENNQGIATGCNQQAFAQIVVTQQNDSLQAYVLQNNQMQEVEQFVYFTNQSGILRTQPNSPVKSMIFLEPNKQFVIFIPQPIVDSMFTKMFFFNGQGLKNFEYVNSWGGEVKLFKIKFE